MRFVIKLVLQDKLKFSNCQLIKTFLVSLTKKSKTENATRVSRGNTKSLLDIIYDHQSILESAMPGEVVSCLINNEPVPKQSQGILASLMSFSQTLNFRNPCFIDDTISIEGEIIEKKLNMKLISIKTTIHNQIGKCLIDGVAKVIVRE